MAARLRQARVQDLLILEQAPEVGGYWRRSTFSPVAGDGREGATPPVTADFRGLLEDQQVLDPGLTQPRSHAQPGYAGSDDRDVNGSRPRAHYDKGWFSHASHQ
ncbi:putative monooxygenase [Mycobacteroides abscessus subsp. abscessus]|nr:putative monooxygenase [Mycobacteroides abscessus subsp. abscessus]